jgi:hypothetical protein
VAIYSIDSNPDFEFIPASHRSTKQTAVALNLLLRLSVLAIAMELAADDPTYEDVASKFWEHFVRIPRCVWQLPQTLMQAPEY